MIIVSNRLPFTVRENMGVLQFIPSIGGLATGLSSYLESFQAHPDRVRKYLWVGWPGSTILEKDKEVVRSRSLDEFNALPVFLSEEDVERFYQGFCNKTIWPLFHYFPGYTEYKDEHWAHYIEVNRSFCRTLRDLLRPDDALWIHDYHLMLLPAMIREMLPSATIGFFLHIPFPEFEMFRLLPRKWRRAILEGLLGSDLIGFHTNEYQQNFLRCVRRILGFDSNIGEIIISERVVKAATFPMGIDFDKYHDQAASSEVQNERKELQKQLKEAKIVLSIDRLDYTKGIANRLEAFQLFLETHHEWIGRVVMFLIVVPSRVDVEHYAMMKKRIESLVGEINGKFGSPGWTPIIYMFRALTFAPLVKIYSASHVALITPLRDGMNLIAKEYIAARIDKTGVLILSEMAGASKELLEAIIINPNDRSEIAEALLEALEMPHNEQVRRNAIMQERLHQYDVAYWAADFNEELSNTGQSRDKYSSRILSANERALMVDQYCISHQRLILLDYDGTLVPYAVDPRAAAPDDKLIDILGDLAADLRNEVVIISGREKKFLDQWFSKLHINLVAEHGAWIRKPDSHWDSMVPVNNDWKSKLKPLLERYVHRVAGSFLEEKDFALVWHYRGADPEPGRIAAQELKDLLLALTANMDLHVLHGNKAVEIRISGITKATGSASFLSRNCFDFILFIGDDETDEDLFAVLPDKAYSLRVGLTGTRARHNIPGVQDVIQLLSLMAGQSKSR